MRRIRELKRKLAIAKMGNQVLPDFAYKYYASKQPSAA